MGKNNEKSWKENQMNRDEIKRKQLPLLIGGGALAGLLNGLLGAGGGIVAVFVLKKLLADKTNDSRDVFAHTVAVILPLCAFSLLNYALRGAASLEGASFFILPAILGGVMGGFLLDKLKVGFVQSLFGLLILISGIVMLYGR